MKNSSSPVVGFPSLLQRFFGERLIGQQNASARTVAAYRDTFRQLLSLQFSDDLIPHGLGRFRGTIKIDTFNPRSYLTNLFHMTPCQSIATKENIT